MSLVPHAYGSDVEGVRREISDVRRQLEVLTDVTGKASLHYLTAGWGADLKRQVDEFGKYKAQMEARLIAYIQSSSMLQEQLKTDVDRKIRDAASEETARMGHMVTEMERRMELQRLMYEAQLEEQRRMFEARMVAQQRRFEEMLERRFKAAAPAPAPATGGGSAKPMPNVVEVADDLPNVVELAEEAPPAVAPVVAPVVAEDRLAAVEHKITLLTEASVSLLAMKAEVEHAAITRCETSFTSYETLGAFSKTGGSLTRPTGPQFYLPGWVMPCPSAIVLSGDAARAKSEWTSAFEELQMASVQTDSLIAALKE